MTTDALIQVRDLKKHFSGASAIKALDGVSTDIRKGEVVVVIGPSGSGKSTFLRCLNLLEVPTGGKILFGGVEVLFDSNEETDNSGFTQTHTIDISSIDSNISTVPALSNMNPFAKQEAKRHAMVQMALIGVLGLVGLGLVGLVVWLVIRMMSI